MLGRSGKKAYDMLELSLAITVISLRRPLGSVKNWIYSKGEFELLAFRDGAWAEEAVSPPCYP